ncbi:MAG: transketolase, partial [Alphaproteobacteria bacterium]|nr:transketolase [Alphaproteobacteria bacterium]
AQKANKPTLISCKTQIGFGAPTKVNSASSHGSPLGASEIEGARKNLNWPHAPFEIPSEILHGWRNIGMKGQLAFQGWTKRLNASPKRQVFESALALDGLKAIGPVIADLKQTFAQEKNKLATRQCSGMVLEKLIPAVPELIGGSADLTGSNNTKIKGPAIVSAKDFSGQYIHYGVREHGMAAIMNGLALHGGIIPYSGTFLVFSDYCRPSLRLAALMKQRVIHVMTHDSIGLGEDGPTHQPVEHLAALRAIPNLYVFRPCDGIETAETWETALNLKSAPSVMALTRQGLPLLNEPRSENKVTRGAYILKETSNTPRVTLYASGSEVEIAHQAYEALAKDGVAVRLVSVPCLDLFWEQDEAYIKGIACNDSVKVVVEAGIRQGWERLTGGMEIFIGMNSFGASAPYQELYKHFGITAEKILEAVRSRLK